MAFKIKLEYCKVNVFCCCTKSSRKVNDRAFYLLL